MALPQRSLRALVDAIRRQHASGVPMAEVLQTLFRMAESVDCDVLPDAGASGAQRPRESRRSPAI